jgi:3-isopropylmalate dehydrogenase
MRLLVIPGDGIGPEITAATLDVLSAADRRFGLGLAPSHAEAGAASLAAHGTTLLPEVLEAARAADGVLLGPMSTFDYTEHENPSRAFRKGLDLFANIRPARSFPGVKAPLGAFDLVVVRENTEGFYADRNMEAGEAEMLVTPDVVVSLRRITRRACERIARAAFALAETRGRRVAAVHKANVLKRGDGMFLDACRMAAREHPGVTLEEIIVDAMAAHLVRNPSRFDVIVTTNMFGDILSDLTAELSGSIGLGGSLNAGEAHAMAQAAHGSAPDIAGQDLANPVSLILSAAMLLRWHGQRGAAPGFGAAAAAIEAGVAEAIATGEGTRDIGGRNGTRTAGHAIAAKLQAATRGGTGA